MNEAMHIVHTKTVQNTPCFPKKASVLSLRYFEYMTADNIVAAKMQIQTIITCASEQRPSGIKEK